MQIGRETLEVRKERLEGGEKKMRDGGRRENLEERVYVKMREEGRISE